MRSTWAYFMYVFFLLAENKSVLYTEVMFDVTATSKKSEI